MSITELTTDADLTRAFPVMAHLRDRTRPETFVTEIRRQQAEGYHLLARLDDTGRIVALAGYRESHTLFRGPHLFVDDLVTAPESRGQGHATALLRHIAQHARTRGIARVYLDSRNTAQGFYRQLGFTFHTSVPCYIDAAALAPEPGV